MSNWTSGYVADIGYVYGYYTELNPYRSQFIMLDNGVVLPEYATACELGFGQGVSTNIHAAATNIEWYGNDFNPAQAGFAQELAAVSGSGAKLYDDSFADFCSRTDLPDFDFIALHGIWSWVSDENRSIIVDFISRKLKAGGVLYVSYNTQPGWAAFAPLRHLMLQHSEVMGSRGEGTVARIGGALEFAEKLMALDPLYAAANPSVKSKLEKLKEQDRHYLAHEYFNRDWLPMHFSTMAKWLEPAKLDFVCSANYADQIAQINLTPEHIDFLQSIPDPTLAQSVRDFIVNSQFRKDYWVKGKRRIPDHDREQQLRRLRVVLNVSRENIEIEVKGTLHEGNVNAEIYDPILDVLADYKPKSIEEIVAATAGNKAIGLAEVAQSVLVLINGGYASHAQSDEQASQAKVRTDALNAHFLKRAKGGSDSDIGYLACPVTGGGIAVSPIKQQYLNCMREGLKEPEQWATSIMEMLSANGQKLTVKGKLLETAEDCLAELLEQANDFARYDLPVLRALQVV